MRSLERLLPFWLTQTLKRIRGVFRGTWPMSVAQKNLAKSASLDALTGKIRFKMAFDRNVMLSTFADKLLVREYVSKKIGERYLSNLIGTISSGAELLSIELPREFVLKSNQGSGGMALVSLIAPSANTLPKKFKKVDWEKYLVHPDRFSLNSAAN